MIDVKKHREDVVSMEGHLASLTRVRQQLIAAGGFDTRIAMEADALSGGSDLTRLAFAGGGSSHKLKIALEGIGSRIWEAILAFFSKIGEWISKILNFLFGKKNVDEEKVDELKRATDEYVAEAAEFDDQLTRMARELRADNLLAEILRQEVTRFEAKISGPVRAIISGGPGVLNPYNNAIVKLASVFRDDPVTMVATRLTRMEAWLAKAWEKATTLDQDVKGLDSGSNDDLAPGLGYREAIGHLNQVNESVFKGDYAFEIGGHMVGNLVRKKEEILAIETLRAKGESRGSGKLLASPKFILARISEIMQDADVKKLGGSLNKTSTEFKRLGEQFDKFKVLIEKKLNDVKSESHHAAREKVANLLLEGCKGFAEDVQAMSAMLMAILRHYRDSVDGVLALQTLLLDVYQKTYTHDEVKGTQFAGVLAEKFLEMKEAHAKVRKLRDSIS